MERQSLRISVTENIINATERPQFFGNKGRGIMWNLHNHYPKGSLLHKASLEYRRAYKLVMNDQAHSHRDNKRNGIKASPGSSVRFPGMEEN